jgi:signal transduction histidine kinase
VRLTIADGGPGVAPADRERLFTRYARGGASDDRDGTGLGLYVGRALAQANGGDLVLEGASEADPDAPAAPRAGAAFTLTLPAEAPTEG